MNNVVEVENLTKQYPNNVAVDGINFEVKEGEILGLLGPNGAGKSTTINILSTVLSPSTGNITIFGYDLKKEVKPIKQQLGVVPQDIAIYEEISAENNVRFFASLYGLKGKKLDAYVKEALELVQLYDKKNEKPKTFSGGMKRRLNIACATAHQPKLIIMDEPTVGIDPQSRNHILESVKNLKKRGATIIYSTHYMEEVETISDRIMIMNDGKIIAQGTKEELNQKVNDEITYSFQLTHTNNLNVALFSDMEGIIGVNLTENVLEVAARQSINNLSKIIAELTTNGYKIQSMTSKEASLETVFLALTGRNLRD